MGRRFELDLSRGGSAVIADFSPMVISASVSASVQLETTTTAQGSSRLVRMSSMPRRRSRDESMVGLLRSRNEKMCILLLPSSLSACIAWRNDGCDSNPPSDPGDLLLTFYYSVSSLCYSLGPFTIFVLPQCHLKQRQSHRPRFFLRPRSRSPNPLRP